MRNQLPIGFTSGHLVVVGTSVGGARQSMYPVRCACGSEKLMRRDWLSPSRVKSCGCMKASICKEKATKHGGSDLPEYQAWFDMRSRCNDPTDNQFANYGARGIRVCERWQKSFEAFFSDLGPRPSSIHSLEREDNNIGYEPDNCCWATPTQQSRNRRVTLWVEHEGRQQKFADLCDLYGLPYRLVWQRVFRYGMKLDAALTKEIR